MKYTITVNQVGIMKAGLLTKTDFVDWAIIEYIKGWFFAEKKKTFHVEGKELVWINYNHLIKNLPFIKIKDKSTLSERFKKLKKLGLIISHQFKDNTLYVRPTDLAISVEKYKVNENGGLFGHDPTACLGTTQHNKGIINKGIKDTKVSYKDSPNPPVFKSAFTERCILGWNGFTFTQNMRVTTKTKTITKVEKYITQLLKGTFLNARGTKSYDTEWFKQNRIPLKLKPLNKREILKAIRDTSLYSEEGYFPENKAHMPKDLESLMYNPRTGKSWFLKAYHYPPQPLHKQKQITDPAPDATKYLASCMNGNYNTDSIGDKMKLINGVKSIKRFVKRIPATSSEQMKIRREVGTTLRMCKEYIRWMGNQCWLDGAKLSILNTDNKVWKRFIAEKEEEYQGYKLQ